MEAKHYPIRKSRFVLMLLVFLLLIVASVLGMFYLYNHPDSDGYVRMPRIVIALPVLGVLGVGLALYNLFLSTKGLTLSATGIQYSVGIHTFGPVAWADINGVMKKRYIMNDFVVVFLHNPANFINTRGYWGRRIYNDNHSTHGSPVVLNASQLMANADDLVAEISKHIPIKK